MSQTKFTPGKWEFLDDRAIVSGGVLIAQTNKINDRNGANATLIAAAPSLYEQLFMARRQLSANGATDEELAGIDVALAKARGES